MCAASKRRICSYDMVEVPPEGYVLAEEQGEMCFVMHCVLAHGQCIL